MKRAALYLRVSTDDQTLANQRPALLKLAKARGFKVVTTYEETGSAAAPVRPKLEEMLEDAHRGAFDVLIVWAIDRLGRSMLGNLKALLRLDGYGVQVISERESWLEMGGPARQLLIGIMSWVAEQERARLSERTIAGMARARAQGLQIGRPRVVYGTGYARVLLAEPGGTIASVARTLKVSESSLRRALKREAAESPPPKGGPRKPLLKFAKSRPPA